jgi:hypothetical protein
MAVIPAVFARAIVSARSFVNRGPSKWQWESTYIEIVGGGQWTVDSSAVEEYAAVEITNYGPLFTFHDSL